MTMAKSLAGGFPLAAIVGKAAIMDAPGAGGLGGTFAASPISCAAALAVIEVMQKENIPERANRVGERMAEALACSCLRAADPAYDSQAPKGHGTTAHPERMRSDHPLSAIRDPLHLFLLRTSNTNISISQPN